MIRRKRVVVVLGAAVVGVGAACGLMRASADGPIAAAVAASRPSAPAPAFIAMQYYDDSCAKCHGPQGSFYGKSLGKDLDDKGLIKVVRDMADGPAQAHLEENEVSAETAFHRALMVGTPYLSVTGMNGDDWSGEVMPDAKVVVKAGGKEIAGKVTDWNWTATVPAGTKVEDVTITATLEGKTTTVKPAEGMYSHTDPIAPPAERKKKK